MWNTLKMWWDKVPEFWKLWLSVLISITILLSIVAFYVFMLVLLGWWWFVPTVFLAFVTAITHILN